MYTVLNDWFSRVLIAVCGMNLPSNHFPKALKKKKTYNENVLRILETNNIIFNVTLEPAVGGTIITMQQYRLGY